MKHFAAIGTDGKRPVVWGLGHSDDPRTAEQAALIEGEEELRNQHDMQVLRTVEVNVARAKRIIAGDVDASDL